MASGQPPFFYHILMNPSSPHLPLPAKFVKKHLRNKILKNPILKSANGGYLWKLKMKKFDDHTFCFVDGWCKVVKDVDLVAMAKIKTKETITLKNDDGYEKVMPVRSYKQNKSTRYYVAEGWKEFQRSNDISEGDDKLCLAKVTKKKPRATEVDNDDMDDDDGMDEGEAEDAKEDDSNVDGDDIFDDEGKGENAKLVNDDEDDEDEDDDRDVDGNDGDPSFILTCSDKNQYHLQSRRNRLKGYCLSAGWKEFQRNSNISEGDQFVFKFITSEDKFCVAKITKNITRARPLPPAVKPVIEVDDGMDDQDVDDNDDMDDDDGMDDDDDMDDDDGIDEEGEAEDAKEDDSNVDGDDIFDYDVDDEGMGENAKLVNENEDDEDDDRDVDGDDGDPSFILTISDKNQYVLRFSADFAALAGINTKKTITLKNLDGYEKELHVRSYVKSHRGNQWKYYYLSAGWKEFQRNSNISKGDKFVFKFITSEDKFCVAKITKKKTPARPLPPAAEDAKEDDSNVDGDDMFGDDVDDEGKGENAKHVNDDEDDEDDDRDVDGDDGDPSFKDMDDNDVMDADEDVELFDDGNPSFVATITPTYNHVLRMPADFARLARLDTKKTLTLKSLDGYEKEMSLQVEKSEPALYYVGSGWKDILQSTSISEGDKCVFKYIASEDKLCLAKIIKKKTQARPQLPVAEAQETEFIDDDKLCLAKLIKKKTLARLQLPVAEAQEKDFNDDDAEDDEDVDDDKKDENKDVEPMDDVDPFFVVNITTSHKYMLIEMVLRPVKQGQTSSTLFKVEDESDIAITLIHLFILWTTQMSIRTCKQRHCSTQYHLSLGWPAFKRSNNILEGDECVFMYITSEDKMSLAKVTKKIIPPTEVDVNDLKVDDGMDGKDVVVDDNKDEDENVEPVDDGMDGKDVVVDDNKDEDENVEPVDDGMDGKDVVVDDNKDEDENVEPVDDGMDGKDVVVDDNKDEDENVKPVDDGMDGKDVVVDDNKDEDENVELVDDGMDVDAYDNKDEDKDVEFVVTITPSHKSKLWLPIDFVASAGIESKENITMKSLDGNETQMSIRTDKQRHRHRSKQYHLSVGWPAFKRSNNISEGDECVFMYATSEDKMCLAKITKKENVDVDDNSDEDEYVELGDGMDDKDVNEDAELVDDEDPFFRVTITPSHKSMLRLPLDFVGLTGINTKKNIIIKSLDGNESQMAVLLQ
ncbi:DNA-binding pseudobarrel domain-containing protein [Tanacetum coccineum]